LVLKYLQASAFEGWPRKQWSLGVLQPKKAQEEPGIWKKRTRARAGRPGDLKKRPSDGGGDGLLGEGKGRGLSVQKEPEALAGGTVPKNERRGGGEKRRALRGSSGETFTTKRRKKKLSLGKGGGHTAITKNAKRETCARKKIAAPRTKGNLPSQITLTRGKNPKKRR